MEGRGRVVFVIGGPGSGKTALLNEFALRTAARRADVLVAAGSSSIFASSDNFCFPACQILNQLVGQLQFSSSEFSFDHGNGGYSHENGDRAVQPDLVPDFLQLLTESGPSLLNVYVPVQYLISAADKVQRWPNGFASRDQWIGRLLAVTPMDPGLQVDHGNGVHDDAVERLVQPGGWPSSMRARQVEQLIRVIIRLAQHRPLSLAPRQCAVGGQHHAPFHQPLGRPTGIAPNSGHLCVPTQRTECRRADEWGIGRVARSAHRHPLQHAVMELQRQYGDITIDLDESDPLTFVSTFLSLIPNCFEDAFIEKFAQQTAGNPLLARALAGFCGQESARAGRVWALGRRTKA